MKVKYKGESCVSLTYNKEYEVIGIEKGWYRIVDDTGEDYLFQPELFEIIKTSKNDVPVIVTVHRPELTPEEREKRMAEFKRATAEFLIAVERQKKRDSKKKQQGEN